MNAVTIPDRRMVDSIVEDIARAWNAGDAAGFTAHFAADATQVNIFGSELLGSAQIRERHDGIFKTIFQGSRNTLQVVDATYAAPDVIIARVSSVVEVPTGPLKGDLRTLASMVLRRSGAAWQIVLFHNTRVQSPPQPKDPEDK